MSYSVEELGRRVKAKYPQYGGMSDAEVGQKVAAKYPQYASSIVATQGVDNWASKIPGLSQMQNVGIAAGSAIGKTGLGLGQAALKAGMGITSGLSKLTGGFLPVDNSLAQQTYDTLERGKEAIYQRPFEKNLQTPSGKASTLATNIGMYFAGGSGPVGGLGRFGSAALRAVPDMVVNAGQTQGAPGSVATTGVASAAANALVPRVISTPLRTVFKNVGAGAVSGEVSDIGTGLAGLRGEDRTGYKSLIPGWGTVAGTTLGALQSIPATRQVFNRGIGNSVRDEFQGTAQDIMNRVARINPSDARKFERQAGMNHGTYLTQRGIYGNDEEIMQQLFDRFTQSKNVADEEIAKLPGLWRHDAVDTAIGELVARESRVSSLGAPSGDLARITELARKNASDGLTMSDINEVKRMFERNIKLDFVKSLNADGVARSNNIDNAIRTWQVDKASVLGFENLRAVNKETQLAKMLGDSLWKKNVGQTGNNAFGLIDSILLAGGDPAAISMFLTRKTLGNKGIQSWLASKIAGEPSVGPVQPQLRGPITDESRLLSAPPPGADYSLNQGRAIPVAPTGSTILTNEQTQIGGVMPTRTPQYGTPSEPYRPGTYIQYYPK